jgi:tetratricopeptide (TPR) repeat protein
MPAQNDAIAKAEAAVHTDPANAELQVALGMAYFHAGQLEQALTTFEHALTLNPHQAAAYNGIGRVRYHTGPPTAAIAAYEQAIALDPHDIDSVYGLGILYSAQLGDYDQAITTFQRGLAHNPTNTFLAASLGSTYARKGQINQALATLEQVREQDPTNSFVLSWLGILYLHLKRYDDAIAACRREIEVEDAHSPHRLLGLIYAAQGQTSTAMTELARAVALDGEDYEARAALAKLYRQAGRLREAEEQLAVAQAQGQADHGEYALACIAAVSGEVDQAIALLEVALAQGLVQRGWARIDPEFAFIQEEPRFQALVGM